MNFVLRTEINVERGFRKQLQRYLWSSLFFGRLLCIRVEGNAEPRACTFTRIHVYPFASALTVDRRRRSVVVVVASWSPLTEGGSGERLVLLGLEPPSNYS